MNGFREKSSMDKFVSECPERLRLILGGDLPFEKQDLAFSSKTC